MPTALTPYMVWIKLIAILALVAAIFGFGYHYGSLITQGKADTKYAALQSDYDHDKQVWADTKTHMAADALKALQEHDAANAVKEKADQDKIASLTTKYQTALKEVNHAKQAALDVDTRPLAPGGADGLWVDVDTNTCAGYPDGRSLVPQAGGVGPLPDRLQCRLSASTARQLDEEAAAANEVVAHYNECVGHLGVATETDPSQTTTTKVDDQGATK